MRRLGRAGRAASGLALLFVLAVNAASHAEPPSGVPAGSGTASPADVAPGTSPPAAGAGSVQEPWSLWDEPPADASWSPGNTSPMWVAGRVLMAVLLVVALVMLLFILLRRYGLTNGATGIGAGRLKLLASLPLGPRRTVYLVRVDGVELLVASAGDGLRLLTELPAPRDATLGTLAAPAPAARAAQVVASPGRRDARAGGWHAAGPSSAGDQASPFFEALTNFLRMDESTGERGSRR